VREQMAAFLRRALPGGDVLWRWYLAFGLCAVVAYLAPCPPQVRAVGSLGTGLSLLVTVGYGVRRHRPRAAAPWVLLALGQWMFATGEALHAFDAEPGELLLPSVDDWLWLGGYLLNIAGLLLLLRARGDGRDRIGSVDAAIAATSAALLLWTYVIAPSAGDPLLPGGERLLWVVYPSLDLLLLAATLRLAVRAGGTAQRLLCASMGTLFLADALYGQLLSGIRLPEQAVYGMWLASYLLVGVGALHPSMVRLTEPQPVLDAFPSARRMWLLAGCSVLAPIVLIVEWLRDEPMHVPVLAGGAVVLFLLVLARVSIMARAMESLTARVAAQRGEQRFRSLVQNTTDVILVLDRFGSVSYETPSAQRVLGYTPGQLLGRRFTGLVHPADVALLGLEHAAAGQPLDGSAVRSREGRLRLADGTWAEVDVTASDLTADAAVGGVVLTIRDIRERRALEQRLRLQASHDPLTGLPNRKRFEEALVQALADDDLAGTETSVLYLDLDDFKSVNDTLGHHVGDSMLQAAAERLRGALREGDVLCRLGGDEFAVVLPATGAAAAKQAGRRLLMALTGPLDLDGRRLRTTTSIGVATRPVGATLVTARDLLAAADTAMYTAKQDGRNRCAVFEDDMQHRLLRRVALEQELRTAVQEGGLTLAYQPVVDLRTCRTIGFEALLRWTSPTYGPISPVEFIPLAEHTGLIVPLGLHVLREACAFVAARAAENPQDEPLGIAVNVSVRQLQEPELVSDVQAALAQAGLPAGLLTLEITESIRLFEGSAQVLRRLKTIGVRVSLDDFGTGYAALSHLGELPIDEIKIDRSFVAALADGGREAHLTRAILDLARSLDLAVVAEGVETEEQAALLRGLGAELAQGYLFSRPLPPADVPALLASERGRTA
jgi:diguanylate cyclase (GGDEF)-like protein/PAS domain S-box-containing protein